MKMNNRKIITNKCIGKLFPALLKLLQFFLNINRIAERSNEMY